MESVFGLFINDKMRLINHKVRTSGVQHRHNITPLDPETNEEVTLHVTTRAKDKFEHVALVYTTDESYPKGSRGNAENGTVVNFTRAKVEWDAVIWDYIVHWEAIIPGQSDDTLVQYRITAWSKDGEEQVADTPNIDDRIHYETVLHYNSAPEGYDYVDVGHAYGEDVFNYSVDTLKTPAWAHDAVIYHIFVDRFYPGDDRDWVQTDDLETVTGGTLWGVRDKMDYLKDLGVNCIWLSPTWESPTFHGYDVTNYDKTEERFGGDEALRAVVEAAHERGIKVLLDMVCNHLSNEHPIFIEAKNNPDSEYRDWFFFDETMPFGYKSFFFVETMPRINLNVPAARDWMIANAVKWVKEFDVDGYRLDVADGPGPNFWNTFRKALREVKPDALIYGEIIDTPTRLRTYAGRLDGVLDFPLNEFLRHTFAYDAMTEDELDTLVEVNNQFYPDDLLRPNFLDNHDMNRFSFLAKNNNDCLKRAATYQMKLAKPLIIYYGTEVGIVQEYGHPETGYTYIRGLMPWGDEQKADVLVFYKELLKSPQ